MFAHLLAGQDESFCSTLLPRGAEGIPLPSLLSFIYLPDHPGMLSIHLAHAIPVMAEHGEPCSIPSLQKVAVLVHQTSLKSEPGQTRLVRAPATLIRADESPERLEAAVCFPAPALCN